MEKTQKKLKILVVDDEPGWRDLLTLELSSEECQVITASTAAEALDFLRKELFDLVITDVRMSGKLDGIDLIQTFRYEKPEQKTIFITGYALEEKMEGALHQGGAVCLKKPFAREELLNAVQLLLAA